jgi:hypothetical protein
MSRDEHDDDPSPEEQDRKDRASEALTEAERLLWRAYKLLAAEVGRAEARKLLYALAKGLPQSRRKGPVDPRRDAALLAAYELAPRRHKEAALEPIVARYGLEKGSAIRLAHGLCKQWRENRLPFATLLRLPANMFVAPQPKPDE